MKSTEKSNSEIDSDIGQLDKIKKRKRRSVSSRKVVGRSFKVLISSRSKNSLLNLSTSLPKNMSLRSTKPQQPATKQNWPPELCKRRSKKPKPTISRHEE